MSAVLEVVRQRRHLLVEKHTHVARDAVRQKVVAMYPDHEVDEFTDLFWSRIQQWRADQ